jgi:TolA-binding protein
VNERWDELADAHAAGDVLSDEEHAFLREFDDDDAAEERQLYADLAALGQPVHDAGDFARAEATLAEFEARETTARRRPWLVAAVAGGMASALAAAAAVALVFASPDAEVSQPTQQDAVITSGTMLVDQARLATGEVLPVDRWVVADARACIHAGEATTCVTARSQLRAHKSGIEVAHGTVEFRGSGELVTNFGQLHTDDATYEVQLSETRLLVTVTSGRVALTDPAGHVVAWGPGETGELFTDRGALARAPDLVPELAPELVEDGTEDIAEDDDEIVVDDEGDAGTTDARRPAAPPPEAGELLAAARRHVAEGNEAKAIAAYGRLQRLHPRSAEARASVVSLGELQLKRGSTRAALRTFERYLSGGGGALAEEAHWGKIRALHRLHRRGDRDAAIDVLRKRFPGSVYLGRASSLTD